MQVIPAKCTLIEQGGIWTLFYDGREYLRLLDATCRSDAEQQVAEMLFMSLEKRISEDAALMGRERALSALPGA
jgi:hypothetical protein